jgi:hypothetical protein
MEHRFQKHYTRDEARALLPQVRQWLDELVKARADHAKYEKRVAGMMAPGRDLGGDTVNKQVKTFAKMVELAHQFRRREIQIKDLDRGLIDFPAIIGGKEVFLCWERGEEDIEFWHELDTGYPGREKLD